MSNQNDPPPEPVVPPTIEENPSATGVVDADEEDLDETAKPETA
jgi:hypothetical protein